jgi:alkylhydroperoxidase family enzyme
MTHPRIAPVTDRDDALRAELAKTLLDANAEPLNLFTTLAHHPLLMRRVNALGGAFLAHGELPPKIRELVILRVAYLVRAEYEFAQHAVIGRNVGVTDNEVASLAQDLESGDWDAATSTILRVVDELVDVGGVGDDLWDALAAALSKPQLIELIFLVGFYRMVADFLRTVRVALDDGVTRPDWA